MAKDAIAPAGKLVVIGGSAGSLDVLLQVIPVLPLSGDTAIVIVMHRLAGSDTQLTTVLSARSKWRVKEADDKETLSPNTIYIAPGGYHLLIEKNGACSLDYSEKINYSRPSIDPTFETAADAYGASLKCLLLSGANADGVKGMIAAKRLGAIVAVQNPDDALVPYMPGQALLLIPNVRVLDSEGIIRYLVD